VVSLFLFLSFFFFFFFVFILTLLFKKTNLYFFAGTDTKTQKRYSASFCAVSVPFDDDREQRFIYLLEDYDGGFAGE